jgi:hypothetical protein
MRTDFFVAAIDTNAGERFVLLRPNDLPSKLFFPSSVDELRKWLASSAVSQEEFVGKLGTMGLPPDEISHQLERARSSVNPIRGEWTWERTTRVGFRNPLGQVVVRKTDDYGGRPFQRLYELQCEECHHRYRRSGFEVHATGCPRCQANR